ncbi:MAG: hypothetical protein Q7S37_01950 [bacterium]|nr:hypothetical protein [bacterium]
MNPPILVTCYVDPDLDGTASVIAYSEFLQKNNIHIKAGIIGNINEESKYIFNLIKP